MNIPLEQKVAFRRRTKAFASSVVRFYVELDKSREELRTLGKQLLRSGTSVAANWRESSRARSPDEFLAKVELCTQEADESQLWLELLRDDCGIEARLVDPIWVEADELIAIFVTMAKKTKGNAGSAGMPTASPRAHYSPAKLGVQPTSGFKFQVSHRIAQAIRFVLRRTPSSPPR